MAVACFRACIRRRGTVQVVTKTEMRETARAARRGGHYDTGRTLWVVCPKCRERVETERQPTSRVSVVKQLDAAMTWHLDGYCGAVAGQ